MGYSAKAIILCEGEEESSERGERGELTCVVWEPSGLTIDFLHITRLEKVTSEQHKHLSYSPFTRAGICFMGCIEEHLFQDFDVNPHKYLAPHIIWFDKTTGGKVYIRCLDHVLKTAGEMVESLKLIKQHNDTIVLPKDALEEFFSKYHIYMDGPLLWATCADVVSWIKEAEEKQTEAWAALLKDPVSVAIATGWRLQLEGYAEIGARILFRYG